MMEHYRKLERMYNASPINEYFKPKLRIESGKAELWIDVRKDFHHAAGAMHGAIYFKALDDATFFAANSLDTDFFVLTATFQIDLLRPVKDGTIHAVAHVTQESGRRIEAEGELYDDAGNLVARGTGTFARSKLELTPDVGYI